jgi:hypothetical protein
MAPGHVVAGTQWPKTAIAFGFALTIAGTTVLAWLVCRIIDLF